MSERAAPERGEGYTVVGVLEDGAGLNQAVREIRNLGVSSDDLTVLLKRADPAEPEPFPDGTRYIVIPDDLRGLEIPIGFAAVFVVSGLLFAFTAPVIGAVTFVFFIALAAVLAAGSFTRVGADPVLTEMEVPSEESGVWNDRFERGKVLLFAATAERRLVRPICEVLRGQSADFYVVDRWLEPQPVSGAMLRRAGAAEGERAGRRGEIGR